MNHVGLLQLKGVARVCRWSVACFLCAWAASAWVGTTSMAQVNTTAAVAEKLDSQRNSNVGSASDSLSNTAVEQWRVRLKEGDINQRRSAAIQTRKLAVDHQVQLLPVFIELLEHEKGGQVRLALFDTLTLMGPSAQDAVAALLTSMRQKFGGRHNEETHQDYRAALALASIGAPAVESLKSLLSDESVNLRAEAALALGRIGAAAQSAIPTLVSLLSDKSERVQRDVVTALGGIGEAAVEPLLESVRQVDVLVRANSLAALGRAAPDDPQIADVVQLGLQDESVEVRRSAANQLSIVKLPEATRNKWLLTTLADEDDYVSAASVNGLIKRTSFLQSHRAELAQLLVGKSDEVAWHAAFLLHCLGTDSVPILLEAANDPTSRPEQLARALSLIKAPLESLLYDALASQVPRSRQVAALALGKIRPLQSATVEQLAARLADSDNETQAVLLQSIAALGPRAQSALPMVRRSMQHEHVAVRMQVIQILSQAATKDEQLVQELNGFLHDSESEVQRAAIDSLRSLGPLAGKSIPAVTQLIDKGSREVAEAALIFLGSHGLAASSSVPHLQEVLAQGGDSAWRIAILKTFSQLGEAAQPAYDVLVKQLDDEEATVREASLQALSNLRLDLAQMQPHLLRALKDPDEGVQSQVANSIRRLGPRSAPLIPELIQLLQTTDTAERVKEILERLERYPVTGIAIPALLKLVAHDNTAVQLHAIRFLGLAGKEAQSVLPQLQPYLQSENEALRTAAKQAIDSISGTSE